MYDSFKAVKVTDHVYWVGAIDWSVRDFHGYLTGRGSTYNAWIASVTEPANVSYIISNHAEMDHSGCLPEAVEAIKPEKVFASVMGAKTLPKHFPAGPEIVAVKDGESLSLGNMEVSFLETRMLHWPDSMFTYLKEERVLFSQDAFGMHLATSERFADEIADEILEYEAARYYANILLPLSSFVTKLLDRVGKLGLEFDVIAPDHGPIWRKDVGRMVNYYGKWAAQERTRKAVVAYDTMWGSTESMAKAIGEGLEAGGSSVRLMNLRRDHRSELATEMLDAGALIVGSPTINNNMFPTAADALTYLKGLKPRNLIGAAFGSYGWSGEAVGHVKEILEEMKVEVIGEPLRAQWVPDDEAISDCYSLGLRVAEELKKRWAK